MRLVLSNTWHNERSHHTWLCSHYWNVRIAPRAVGSYRCRNQVVVRFGNNRLVNMRPSHLRQNGSIICQKSKSLPLFTICQIHYITKTVYTGRLSVQACTRQYAFRSDSQQSILVKGRSNILHWVWTGVSTLSITFMARCDAFKYRQRIFPPTVRWRWT